jgi:hypothetical protein
VVAGLDVIELPPTVAAIPAREGIEKNVDSQAAGDAVLIVAAPSRVTARGLFVSPLAATVNGVVNTCVVPLVAVAKLHVTPLGVLSRQPVWGIVSALVVYPVAEAVLVGKLMAVMVTGNGFGLAMLTTTSPVPPG